MCEPCSVALHAIKKLGDINGKNILITGAGPIGIIVGLWAAKFGANRIYFIDIDEQKIKFAQEFGFLKHNGEEVDCSIEGTGAASAITSAINSVKAFGSIVLMGNPSKNVDLTAKDYQSILRKELYLSGTWNSKYSDEWHQSLEEINKGELNIKKLITHEVSLDGCIEAFEMIRDRKEFYCKVVAKID